MISVAMVLLMTSSLSNAQASANKAAQNTPIATVTGDLTLITVGNETMSSGRRGGFRIYKASDGTKAQVSYARFETVQDANRQTQLWLKVAGKTLFETDRQDSRGELTETRTITQGRDEESGRRSFMIIKRNGTNCYFVRSHSLAIAMQAEGLIQN